MSIVPASCLSSSDLSLLGNNLRPAIRQDRSEMLGAVNRSLDVHQEQVDRLHALGRVRRSGRVISRR